jgi:hypothetical protein
MALQRDLVDGDDHRRGAQALARMQLLVTVEQRVAQAENEPRLGGEQDQQSDDQRQRARPLGPGGLQTSISRPS